MNTAKLNPTMTEKMSDDMDDPIRFLETHRNTLVTFINPEFFIDKLRSHHAFSIDDDQDIQSGHGKRNKARIFLDILRQKGKKGFDIFMTYLEWEYSEVYEKITGKKAIVPDNYVPQPQSRMSVLLPRMSELLNDLVKQHAEKKDMTVQLEKLKCLVEYDKSYKKDLEIEVRRLQEQDIYIGQLRQDNIHLMNAKGELERIRGDLATQSLQYKIDFDQERSKNRDLQHKSDSLQKALTDTQERLEAVQEGNRSSKEDSGVHEVNELNLDSVQSPNDGGIQTDGHEVKCNFVKQKVTQQEIFENDIQELRQSNEESACRLTKAEDDLCAAEEEFRQVNQELLVYKEANIKLNEEIVSVQKSKNIYYTQLKSANADTQNLIEERKREQERYESLLKQMSQLQENFFLLESGKLESSGAYCSSVDGPRPRCTNVKLSKAKIVQGKLSEHSPDYTPDKDQPFKYFENFSSIDDDNEAVVESTGDHESLDSFVLRQRRMKRTDTERVNVPNSLRFADRIRAVDVVQEGNDRDILHRAAFRGYRSPGQESEENCSNLKYGMKSPIVDNGSRCIKSPTASESSHSFKSTPPSDVTQGIKSRFYDESSLLSIGSNDHQFVKVKRSSSERSERSNSQSGEMKIEVSCRHFSRTLEIEGGNRTGHFVKHIDASSALKYGDNIVKLHLLSETGLYDLKYSFIDITAEEAAQVIQSCTYRINDQPESLYIYVKRDPQAHEAYKAFMQNNTNSCGDCFYVSCNFPFSPLNNDTDALSFNKDDILEVVNTVGSNSHWVATNYSQNQRCGCTDIKYGTIPNTQNAVKLFNRQNSRTAESPTDGTRSNFNRVAVKRGQKRSNSLPYERVKPVRGDSE